MPISVTKNLFTIVTYCSDQTSDLLLDYSMLDWCDSFNGAIVTGYNY